MKPRQALMTLAENLEPMAKKDAACNAAHETLDTLVKLCETLHTISREGAAGDATKEDFDIALHRLYDFLGDAVEETP